MWEKRNPIDRYFGRMPPVPWAGFDLGLCWLVVLVLPSTLGAGGKGGFS